MKIFKNIITISVLALVVLACKNNAEPEVKTVEVEVSKNDTKQALDPNATYAKVEFSIDGMTCAMGCAKTIEKKMAKMEGVKMAKVDFEKELAMVEYDQAKVSPSSLKEAVAKVSKIYEVKEMKTVDQFSPEKELDTKKACKADCKMACCKDKTKTEKTKMTCAKDCEKACCKAEKV
ncbi:MAG: heavy-metal-associated domain-containing protein [Winogradskyella sp.]|uniref:cation transporter n=1 Tax=Winogradskyella sp. TaxID=1883156 RepID=UPI0017FDE928|nr:heavy metal-associated domain-containing protein [Winogradskyella sp.]MBT8243666.1 cation transporter [Winogradskyella sp.]NNK23359.1 heavy-metal-associated domain-containing protein [Winogradskyella sp.]